MDSVENWLGHMGSEQTKKVYRRRLSIFCNWCTLSPEQLLALKDDPNNLEAEHLLDRFVASAKFSDWQKLNIVTTVKSFFTYNYKELQRVSGKVSAAKQTPYRTPTADLLRKFIGGAWNIRDKALVAFVASTFFREGTIPKLNWGHIEEGAILEPNFSGKDVLHIGVMGKNLKGGGKGRYAGVEQHAFLTPETCGLLLEYKRWRETRGETITKDTPLFVREVKPYKRMSVEAVRNIFKAASKRSGVEFSPHDFRRYGQTQLEEARLPPNWIKKILGHKVKGEENPYSRPKIEQLRQAYREALPHLIFIEKRPVTNEDVIRLRTALDHLRLSGKFPEEQLKKWESEWLGKEPETAIRSIGLEAEAIERVAEREGLSVSELIEGGYMISKDAIKKEMEEIQKERTQSQTSTNGGSLDCQRIVEEEELPALLAEGWRVSAVLPSGKIVVSSD